ncbi:hypothetical protein J1N09_03645 [Aureitalea sp. L0-47]|uniref:beta strand repeat-containing protein n=1 Tax=Aureitalea sp. L0-47 TaxID=2816962 RepID=UPI002238A7D4|nr:hypothetical protein [Aureitalea sp. L0-47]MCW5518917.1 hypothetical protein [Aureitalea sp. L0-47]
MKRYILLVAVCFVGYVGHSQVGIGNTDPKSSLDISASSAATPSNTDGILIPRIDNFPSSDPGADQDGMLVFVTGNGTPAKGFYFWDNGTMSWVLVSGAGSNDSDWFITGTSNPSTAITDNLVTQGSVTVGTDLSGFPNAKFFVKSDVTSDIYPIRISPEGTPASSANVYGSYITDASLTPSAAFNYQALYNNFSSAHAGSTTGLYNNFSSNGGSETGVYNRFNSISGMFGIRNEFIGSTSSSAGFTGMENRFLSSTTYNGIIYGLNNVIQAAGNSARYGVYNSISGSGTGDKYGSYTTIPASAGGQHYGVYSDVQNASGYAGYFIGRSSFGTDPSTGRYLLPAADGTSGQVLTTNGSGQLSFADQVTGANSIDELSDGKSDSDGTNNGSSVFLGINAGANDDSSDNQNLGIGFQSMFANTTGAFNTGLGYGTLQSNATSSYHTAIGHEALNSLNGGSGNVALGYRSLFNTTSASDNVGLGLQSIFSNTTGLSNVALGSNALYSNTTGNQNVALGRDAAFNYSGSGSVFIGYQAGFNESNGNRLYIENSNADSGNALVYGEFDNDLLRINGTFQLGVPSGTGYAFPTTDGTAGQVLATDGAGLLSFTDPSADVDWYEVGTTSAPNAIGDDMFTQGNVVIGATTNPANVKFYVESDPASTTTGIRQSMGAASSGLLRGIDNNITANGTTNVYALSNSIGGNSTGLSIQAIRNSFSGSGGRKTAMYNSFSFGFGGEARGMQNDFNNSAITNAFGSYNSFTDLSASASGSGVFNTASGSTNVANLYGSRTIFSGATVSGSAYGEYAVIQTSGTDYGVYAQVDNNATDYAGYFIGRASFGNDSAVGRYLMPAADGAANQVMATNGSGQLGFVDIPSNDGWYEEGTTNPPNAITDNIYTQGRVGIGDSTPDAVLDMEYNGTLDEGLSINYLHANSGATGAALDILARSGDSGIIRGSSITIDNSASASAATGIYISNSAQASANYGYVTQMTGSGNSNTGLLSQVSGSGNFNYGIQAFATNATTNWAGFFGAPGTAGSGNVYVQDRLRADGIFQYVDGNQAAGRVLASNASGEASWANPAAIFTDTDDQTVDTFTLVGNNLGISLEDDGQPIQTVDLSNVNFNVSNFALAKMNMTTGQTISPPNWTKLNFSTAVFDLGSDFDTGTDRFDVSETGYYRITATIRSSNTSTATNQFGVAVYVDGTLIKSDTYHHQGNGVVTRKVETIESLTAGQYIEIYAYAQTGITIASDPTATTFEVERIR